jgi:hypothetical protein
MDYGIRVWEFVTTVATNWFSWVAAVPFVIDQIVSRNLWSPAANKRISTWWPEETRYRLLKRLAVAGLAVSCFMAFDQANMKLKEQREQVQPTQLDENARRELRNLFEAFQRQAASEHLAALRLTSDVQIPDGTEIKRAARGSIAISEQERKYAIAAITAFDQESQKWDLPATHKEASWADSFLQTAKYRDDVYGTQARVSRAFLTEIQSLGLHRLVPHLK